MFHVYILQSEKNHTYYYGFTSKQVKSRLAEHNNGESSYTSKYLPWKLVWYAGFVSEQKARDFERYLKTGSGHAFSRKRFLLK